MKTIWNPIFSMRSYITGKYDISKDGNFQLCLARIGKGDHVTIPKNSVGLEELQKIGLLLDNPILEVEYGNNAVETRHEFWKINQEIIDQYISDHCLNALITDITGYKGVHPFMNNFNITKNPDNPRSYIDQFITSDVESINRAYLTTVLNQNQIDYLVSIGVPESKLKLDQRVIKKSIIEKYLAQKTKKDFSIFDGIFFPFRVSDKCYQFSKVCEYANTLKKTVFITDPNHTFYPTSDGKYNCVETLDIDKVGYYKILSRKPSIMYNENPKECFHPGLAELLHFDCDIFSYDETIVDEIYKLKDKIYVEE